MNLNKKRNDIFNSVVKHLHDQKGPSMSGKQCMYRGPDSKQCAVGCLIADEFYSEELEHRQVFDPEVKLALIKSLGSLGAATMSMLYDLQRLHDTDYRVLYAGGCVRTPQEIKQAIRERLDYISDKYQVVLDVPTPYWQ